MVLRAVQEVLSHPEGGKVEVMVYPRERPGQRRVVGHVSLWGKSQFQAEVQRVTE
jgi:hypothetical protein